MNAEVRRWLAWLVLALALQGCAGQPTRGGAPVAGRDTLADLLDYHRRLQELPLAELEWERQLLAAEPLGAEGRIRLAMALGQPRGAGNPARAQALLDGLARSNRPEAARLQPLARLLAGQYQEAQRSAALAERLGLEIGRINQQVRAQQQRAEQLQLKLEALANIEHNLPMPRPATEK